MGNIGDSFSPPIPPVGTGGPDYATQVDAVLTELVSRVTSKVPLSALSLTGGLPLSGSTVTDAGYLTLVNAATNPGSTPSPVNRVTAFGGDLWYVGPSGAVQITSGSLLNAAALAGLTGDYGGANPAQLRYDTVNSRYDFYSNFGTSAWADVRAFAFNVVNTTPNASPASARIRFAGSSNKTYTLPTAAATAADRPLYMDSTGQITCGHASRSFVYSWYGAVGSGNFNIASGGIFNCTAPSTTTQAEKSLEGMPVGLRMTAVNITLSKGNTNTTTVNVIRQSAGVLTTIGTATSTTLGAQVLTVTLSSPETVVSGRSYFVQFTQGQNNDKLFHIELVADMQP